MPITLSARAVLLDMDGTLVDSSAVVERAWREWGERNGVDFARIEPVMHGRQASATLALLVPECPASRIRSDAAWLLERETNDIEGITAIPGAAALLTALTGAPHALVTSAGSGLARVRMAAAGLPLPPTRVFAEDVTESKPAPEGFLRAAELLGVDPAECVVFEDSAAGIEAGLAARMRVVAVAPQAADARVTPDARLAATVPDLTHVVADTAAGGAMTLTIR